MYTEGELGKKTPRVRLIADLSFESANQRREENVPKRSGRHLASDIASSVWAVSGVFASLNCNVS